MNFDEFLKSDSTHFGLNKIKTRFYRVCVNPTYLIKGKT
ncbi:hypothetical protein PL8927_630042 [Planktothrix serta PCC 8927]|uniref:Uncharacterized protein n=1 Tax=Planktothrix serta PCC 8927 TaxID=671068 RepID=A0A7Z9BRP8_9CYAN|nr:hypothetical protein PL8927_630042 [Planktothrix serta PCC 8927]